MTDHEYYTDGHDYDTPTAVEAFNDESNYHDGYWRCGRADDCGQPAGWGTDHRGAGACKLHGGVVDEDDGRGAPEGNTNAVTVEAWTEDFVTGFLKDDEIDRVKDLSELLDDPTSSQEVAARAASLALEQFRRTGDDRFLRRYESICDKANLFPEDAETEVSLSLEDMYD